MQRFWNVFHFILLPFFCSFWPSKLELLYCFSYFLSLFWFMLCGLFSICTMHTKFAFFFSAFYVFLFQNWKL
ncbi:hypothetical protein VNO78_33273 [Psophocarpus tetragonolobus]|uniref:Uncharacterized protein n=1 Tax=Psophocarpus tetragonolobus TaxID=3891 RepID=A0AAN9NWZ7_PSOTE